MSQPPGSVEKAIAPIGGMESAPDSAEMADAEFLDDPIARRGHHTLPVVGLGGSAGAIEPLQAFFEAVDRETGCAYVVVLHLSPEHESRLAEILQRSTKMPVMQVTAPVKVQPDHVYVIPPTRHLSMADGQLHLRDPDQPRGRRVAVDLFFRTLADTHGPHATAIVLSGADADGAIGIKRIKERGGLTIAQDPTEAGHEGMPRAAIGTGMVDWVLPVAEMPGRLAKYRASERRIELPEDPGDPPALEDVEANAATLRDLLAFLRARTGHDFSYYKRGTILRRIGRRMQVNGEETLADYLQFLRTHPGEAGALLQDLLISVTNFFRDREAFDQLGPHIPALFRNKGPDDEVRVWVAACATGEEAYSMAMLLCEHAATLPAPPKIQVFATDIDESAIAVAREGLYPETIVADVSEERLRRFFVKEHRGYRVRRSLRETVLFALHDMLKDAPFSRLDLVSCRNLLIYLNRPAQARAFDIFHFALQSGGLLFLSPSESAEDASQLFAPVEKKARLYRRVPTSRPRLPVPLASSTLDLVTQRAASGSLRTQGGPEPSHDRASLQIHGEPAPRGITAATWAELHFRLIERLGPPSLIVNDQDEIVHLSPSAGRFLQFAGGEPSTDIVRVVRPELRTELRAALLRARHLGEAVDVAGVVVEFEGDRKAVDIGVRPTQEFAPGFWLVLFRERSEEDTGRATPGAAIASVTQETLLRHLEEELDHTKARLRERSEQYEAQTEELKASNEELQATNEELRSATEELETGREELQSINEELTTVNHELKGKVEELSRSNSDLQNLMAATNIASIFLDRELHIKRYTPNAVALFNLIPSDVERPLSDLTHRLDYPDIVADAQLVLGRLAPREREVRTSEDRWFHARMLPYRTAEDKIAGVALTFIDITERKRGEEEAAERTLELERFNKVAVGREMRMIELKKEINALCERLGEERRYPLEFTGEP